MAGQRRIVPPVEAVTVLTFDLFGTVLDLAGGLVPPIRRFLETKSVTLDADAFWGQWRARQRIEQYQDTILMLGHSGYLETCRRALVYCLRDNSIEFSDDDVAELMDAWTGLKPFGDALRGMKLLEGRYRLVALSNGDRWLLDHLAANSIGVDLDSVISVDSAGVFKPHPSVYRTAVRMLGVEPSEIMMVAAHAFDVMGARACGFRGAYVNRYSLPFGDTPYRPDIEVADFDELASTLAGPDGP